jgi:hypothetical protein
LPPNTVLLAGNYSEVVWKAHRGFPRVGTLIADVAFIGRPPSKVLIVQTHTVILCQSRQNYPSLINFSKTS